MRDTTDTAREAQANGKPKRKASSKPKLRHVKTVVQHHLVLDDGNNLLEQVTQPLEIPASQWRDYSNQAFPETLKALERELLNPKDG